MISNIHHSFILLALGDGYVHIFKAVDQFPPIEETVLDFVDLLPVVVARDALSPAEAAAGLGDRADHARAAFPGLEVEVDFRGELETIEVAADEPVGIELLISGEEFAIECKSAIVWLHSLG
jgi:hypothetical protein